MNAFGKRLIECRKEKGLSQQQLAKTLNTSYTLIGRYERSEVTPSIEVAQRIATILETTVGYLLGESEEVNIFKDPQMLRRFQAIQKLNEDEKKYLLFTVDAVLRDAQTRQTYIPS